MSTTDQPNVLLVTTDQQRFDTIAALGNGHIYTPNLDRLVESGVSYSNAYSQCPVCVPARYNLMTGREMPETGYWENDPTPATDLEERTGPFLPRAMGERGYRTFGVGKFHTFPYDLDLGFDHHQRRHAYGDWVETEHPEYEDVQNTESGELYFMPQTDALPAEATRAAWTANETIDRIQVDDDRPFFGVTSFMGPHAPHTPPAPFNRLYDPDKMPSPVQGDLELDHMDEQIPWMNHLVWAEEVDDLRARILKARYYGEITHIDRQIGRILDALENAGERENTLVVFTSDHGEHLGDHHAWQKESFFEASTRIPLVFSWPEGLPAGERREELACLTDLFGVATRAAGHSEVRDGIDLLGSIRGETESRERLFGYYKEPGTQHFKIMIREDEWKYIFMANGGREQLFNVEEDPDELTNRLGDEPRVADRLRQSAIRELRRRGETDALDGDALASFPYEERERRRLGSDFPDDPAAALDS